MGETERKPLGEQNYEPFADRYADWLPTKPHNAYYERPATLSLLPDVSGLRVLDLGCGPGLNTEELLNRGADVVAVDVTPRMIELTRERVGDRATILRADAEQPLTFAGDGEFDFVLAALMLDYIDDWRPLFHELRRVLKPGGRFQFSCGHPQMDFWLVRERIKPESNYFDRELFDYPWPSFGTPVPVIRSYRRSMSEVLMPLVEAGFKLEQFLEPLPTDEYRKEDPKSYAKLTKQPNFLCIRAATI
jgi:SAM-dependent methyltransferase